MASTFGQMKTSVRVALGDPDLSELPDVDLVLMFNKSLWEISDKFPFREKETTATFSTIIGTRNYDLPTLFEGVRGVSIKNEYDDGYKKLIRIDSDEYEEVYDATSYSQGFPNSYMRENCFLRLHPVPDKVYTILLRYLKPLSDLAVEANIPGLPQNWLELVELGALWRGWLRFNDYNRVNAVKMLQASLINSTVSTEAKEQKDSRYAGVEVLRNGYDDFIDSSRLF